MARVRVSTTVDADLLASLRGTGEWGNDAALLDAALTSLAAARRRAEIDASYAAYDEIPFDAPDEWGDLASWSEAAGRT